MAAVSGEGARRPRRAGGAAGGEVRLGPGGEFDLIRRLLTPASDDDARSTSPEILLGPGDDCAVVAGLALSVDLVVEGVHFRREWLSPAEIGWRAAAAALSDLAAMAARPIGVLAAIALREEDAGDFAVEVAGGIRAAAGAVGAAVLGGDVSRTPGPLVIDIAVVGSAPTPVRRAGARPGDELWVTGALGAAGAAVRAWGRSEDPSPEARRAFARPEPRTREALWLVERALPAALIDLSDGLGGDAAHVAAAGAVAVVLEVARIPVDDAARAEEDALELALGGGEDYELCFAARPGIVEPHVAAFQEHFGLRLTRVGMVREGSGVYLRDARGGETELRAGGYGHFKAKGG